MGRFGIFKNFDFAFPWCGLAPIKNKKTFSFAGLLSTYPPFMIGDHFVSD
jgi:hypothetical protein